MTQNDPDNHYTSDNLCAKPYKMKSLTSISDRDAGGAVIRIEDKVMIAIAQKQLEAGIFHKTPMIFLRVVSYLDWIKDVTGIDPRR